MKSVKLKELLVVVFNHDDLNSRNLYNTLENLYNEIGQHKLFILDLSNIRHLNQEALGSLIQMQLAIENKKKALRMYQTKEQIKNVYKELHLETVMSMTDDPSKNNSGNTIYYIN